MNIILINIKVYSIYIIIISNKIRELVDKDVALVSATLLSKSFENDKNSSLSGCNSPPDKNKRCRRLSILDTITEHYIEDVEKASMTTIKNSIEYFEKGINKIEV